MGHWRLCRALSVAVVSHSRQCSLGFGPLRCCLPRRSFITGITVTTVRPGTRNFAGQLSFLDALFGTLHLPRGQMPSTYGLDRPMPQRYVPELLYPFIGEKAFIGDKDFAAQSARGPDIQDQSGS